MNYPDKVLIRGYHYDVYFIGRDIEVDKNLKEEYIGQISPGSIRVSVNQQPFGILDTFMHEILHGVFNKNPVLNAAIKPEIGNEAFIDTLSTDLANLLVTNNWITLPESVSPTLTRIHDESVSC